MYLIKWWIYKIENRVIWNFYYYQHIRIHLYVSVHICTVVNIFVKLFVNVIVIEWVSIHYFYFLYFIHCWLNHSSLKDFRFKNKTKKKNTDNHIFHVICNCVCVVFWKIKNSQHKRLWTGIFQSQIIQFSININHSS